MIRYGLSHDGLSHERGPECIEGFVLGLIPDISLFLLEEEVEGCG